jgi:hypothetical protein
VRDACCRGGALQVLRRAPKEIQDGIVLERRGVRDVDDDVRLSQYLLKALTCEAINPGRWRSRRDMVSARLAWLQACDR